MFFLNLNSVYIVNLQTADEKILGNVTAYLCSPTAMCPPF